MDLHQRKCRPCEKGSKPLTKEQLVPYLDMIPDWQLDSKGAKISKEYTFKDFLGSMHFVEQVADVAEMEDHHPDIYIFYNRVRLELTTHAIEGLSENDFIVASKINGLWFI